MANPPSSPTSSDIEGVHRDGTRPSKPLPPKGQDSGDLEEAAREGVARPDYADEEAKDDRTG